MFHRGRIRAVARSWGRRARPSRRRDHDSALAALHDDTQEPGLTGLRAKGRSAGIAWYESGPEDAELTIVFIHGYGLSAESYYQQVAAAQADDAPVRCLLVDLRGHGQSEEVASADCTVSGAGDDVLKIIDERAPEGRLIIVGHSLGGMVAQNVIRRAPESVYGRINSVLLIATAMRPFARTGAAALLNSGLARFIMRLARRMPAKVNRFRREVAELIAPVFAALVTGFPQMEQLQFHVAMMVDTPLSSYVGFFDDLLEHDESGAAERLSRLPGTIMVGTMDIITPQSQSEVILEHWPSAQLVEVPRSGHMVILEEPESVSRELRQLVDAAGASS